MRKKNQQFKSSIAEGFKASRVLESLSNYSISDKLKLKQKAKKNNLAVGFDSDESFWRKILKDPSKHYNSEISLSSFSMSSWVPRVPGLYWSKYGQVMRDFSSDKIESVNGKWVHYTPKGKSSLVLGGIGSIQLNPDRNGNRIVSLSSLANSSTGIPAILTENVWKKLGRWDRLNINLTAAKWVEMENGWDQRFPFTEGIPRAYLLIDDPHKIKINREVQEGVYHPFSIMEYYSGEAIFYDYVFCTVNHFFGQEHLDNIASFFESYRIKDKRNGEYLIQADSDSKFLSAKYSSPSELLRVNNDGRTYLELINERVKDKYYSGLLLDDIIKKIATLYTTDENIKRIGTYAGIPSSTIATGSPIVMINSLVKECLRKNCMEVLIDKVIIENPQILSQ